MVEPQASRFWQATLRSGLLEEPAMAAAWAQIPPEKRTLDAIDRRLARQVVNSGGLTLWQAQQILAGRWQGLRIEKYTLLDVIGHGGMGRVYLARDTRLGRPVALKILSRERMNNPRALARFRREAKVGAKLQHENLVRIYDEGEAHGVRYLVMEYIAGKTIGRLIADFGRLPPGTAADLARQVALGLEHLHQKGLLHRDVNPLNILVDDAGTAKLTDLGLAIDTGDPDDMVTRDGATVGTFDYISPEQARHSRSADARSDIYSLGCSLYHMIAGRVPFPSPSLPEKLYAHQISDPEPLSSLAPGVPAGLEAVVRKSMQKSPDARYARPIEMARALERFAGGALPHPAPAGPDDDASDPRAMAPGDRSASTPAGSDPDLDLNRGVAASAPVITPATDPSGYVLKIDFGPDRPLSGARPAAAPSAAPDADDADAGRPSRWLVPALTLGVLAVAAGLVASWAWRDRLAGVFRPATTAARPPGEGPAGPADSAARPAGPAEFVLRFPDGQEEPHPDLRHALERASNMDRSEVVVKTSRTIRADDPGKPLRVDLGKMAIRAADGAHPVLQVAVSGQAPWIVVGPQASLTVAGIRFEVEAAGQGATPPGAPAPALIRANGNATLDRCAFSIAGDERGVRALAADGLVTRVTSCLFEGFDRPIELGMFPGADAQVTQCLFVRDATGNLAAGWAISAAHKAAGGPRPARVGISRCTALGTGLVVADGFEPATPLEVVILNSTIRAGSLVMTQPAQPDLLPRRVRWTGRDNWYQITGAAWAVVLPQGFAGPAAMPTDLKTWADLMGGESGGREDPIPFAGASTGEGRPLEDFAIKAEPGKPAIGIDPKLVGPSAPAGKP